jgi:hypothetical protein
VNGSALSPDVRSSARQPARSLRRRGFVLMEAMIAVAIFALGVLALGRCVENCMVANFIKEDDARVRLALRNRMLEIQTNAIPLTDKSTEELKGMFTGIKLRTTRVPLKRKNEKDEEIFGIFTVKVEALWTADGQDLTKELTFYVYPRQR